MVISELGLNRGQGENMHKPLDVVYESVDEDNMTRRRINVLATTPEDNIQKVAEITRDVASFADQSDIIIVSGGSGKLTKTLLLASGIHPRKVVTLSPPENAAVYKSKNAYATAQSSFPQRVAETKEILDQHGVSLINNPSISIIDDHVDKGNKAKSYVAVVSAVSPGSDISFGAFSAPRIMVKSKSQPQLPEGTFIPQQVLDPEYKEAHYYLARLAFLASRLHRQGKYRPELSKETILVGEQVLKTHLQKLYHHLRSNPMSDTSIAE